MICECSSSWKIRQSREIMTRSVRYYRSDFIQARLALHPCKEYGKPHWCSGLKSYRLPLGKQPDPSWREISARTKLAFDLLAPHLTPQLHWHPECSHPSRTISPQGCPINLKTDKVTQGHAGQSLNEAWASEQTGGRYWLGSTSCIGELRKQSMRQTADNSFTIRGPYRS